MNFKNLSGTYFFAYMLLVIVFKFTMGYYILSDIEFETLDSLLTLVTALIQTFLVWHRAKRFYEFYFYFSFYVVGGIIHTIGAGFNPEDLINSSFYNVVNASTIGVLILFLVLTFKNANRD